jgi:hypothetical protein
MAVITTEFGAGGRGLTPGHGAPDLATVLRDVADDLAGGKVAAITSPDASDAASAATLANEIKTKLNAANAYTIKTTKG